MHMLILVVNGTCTCDLNRLTCVGVTQPHCYIFYSKKRLRGFFSWRLVCSMAEEVEKLGYVLKCPKVSSHYTYKILIELELLYINKWIWSSGDARLWPIPNGDQRRGVWSDQRCLQAAWCCYHKYTSLWAEGECAYVLVCAMHIRSTIVFLASPGAGITGLNMYVFPVVPKNHF